MKLYKLGIISYWPCIGMMVGFLCQAMYAEITGALTINLLVFGVLAFKFGNPDCRRYEVTAAREMGKIFGAFIGLIPAFFTLGILKNVLNPYIAMTAAMTATLASMLAGYLCAWLYCKLRHPKEHLEIWKKAQADKTAKWILKNAPPNFNGKDVNDAVVLHFGHDNIEENTQLVQTSLRELQYHAEISTATA